MKKFCKRFNKKIEKEYIKGVCDILDKTIIRNYTLNRRANSRKKNNTTKKN